MASKSSPIFSSILRQLRPRTQRSAPLQRCLNLPVRSTFAQPVFIRAAHSIPRPLAKQRSNQTDSAATGEATREGKRPELKDPAYYQLSFTCVPCGYRSHHNVSKQGYHKGSTLITCPECRNRHVISDHLNIFGDRKMTVEDLMREKGQLVKKGSLGEDGDIEFWPEESYAQQEGGDGKTGSS